MSFLWTLVGAYFTFGRINGSGAPLISRIGENLQLHRSSIGIVMAAGAFVHIGADMPDFGCTTATA